MTSGMNQKTRFALAMLLAVLCVGQTKAWAQDRGALVAVQPGVSPDILAIEHGTRVVEQISNTNIYRLATPSTTPTDQFVAELNSDLANVALAKPDSSIRLQDEQQEHYSFTGVSGQTTAQNQSAFRQVQLRRAQRLSTGVGVIIAIVDTGVDFNHPDLQGHLLPGKSFIPGDTDAWDKADGLTNIAQGHGTIIAGLCAAIAPDAQILPLRVLNGDGIGYEDNLLSAIYHAIDAGAQVINLSLSGTGHSYMLDQAIADARAAGVLVVTAAGNQSADLASAPLYPALSPFAVTVTSLDEDFFKSDFANYGDRVNVCAPGAGILSTFSDDGYVIASGTSFACAFVTAEAALLYAAQPNATADTVQQAIVLTAQSVDWRNPDYTGKLGAGIVRFYDALQWNGYNH